MSAPSVTFASAPQRFSVSRVAGVCLLALLASIAIIGPFLPLADPLAQDLQATLLAPSLAHPLGTDHLGRCVLSRLVHGAARSLGLAVLCVGVASGAGIALGLVAAIGGRFLDAIIMRLADLMLAFPGLLLALLLTGLMGSGIVPMLIGIKLTLWPQFARMARAGARAAVLEAHVEAARLAGFSWIHVLARNVLPPVLRQCAPLAALGVGAAILSISSLGFLGLGLQPPAPEWGAMIAELVPYLSEAPVQMASLCLAIALGVLAATLIGESLAGHANGPGA